MREDQRLRDTEPLSRAPGDDHGRRDDLETGRILEGRYKILRRIGAGGMGIVYLARRLRLDDLVALKRLAPISDSNFNRSRFLLEARAAAHIRHPNVVEIFDFGDPPDEPPYIVMEYIEGPTLADRLSRGPLDVARALEIFAPICAAVEAGHRRGIIHRDLKPANIILATSDDGREIVKVLDFGLAFVTQGQEERLTLPGSIIGTARYMAPEQARAEEVVPATDIFTLGILLYEMVTGEVPFQAPTPVLTALKVSEGIFEPPDVIVPDLPRPLVDAILQALRQDPAERPESPEQLARLAEAHGRSTTSPSQPATTRPDEQAPEDPSPGDQSQGDQSQGDQSQGDQPQGDQPPGDSPVVSNAPAFDHFVGRERQLRRLREEYAQAAAGSGRIVLVIGEAGVGKTRLVENFTETLQTESQVVILWGRFFDYEGNRPAPLESFVDILRADSRDGEDGRLLGETLGIDKDLEGDSQRWRVFAALTEAFAARAASRPLVLVLDDIQWATAADLELIDHLQRSLASRGTLVIATARKAETCLESKTELACWIERLGSRRTHTSLSLRPFDDHELREWLDRVFGGLVIHPQDLRRLARATDGNPYYLSEVVRHLLTADTIDWLDGWRCHSLDTVELPESVTHLVRARLQEVAKDLYRVLEIAAVVGTEWRFETVQLATEVPEDRLETLLEHAVRILLLAEDGVSRGNDYRFTSETLRQVLYNDMPRRRRRRAHSQVVAALHVLHKRDLSRMASVLAYHHHAIEDWQEAAVWGIRALAAALERSDNDTAAVVQARVQDAMAAAEWIPPAERQRFDLLTGSLCRRLGRLQNATAPLLRAAESPEEPALRVAARLELAHCHLDRGDLPSAAAAAREAGGDARRIAAAPAELEAKLLEATCLFRLGRARDATTRLDQVLAELGDDGPAALRSRTHREKAWGLLKSGAFGEAQRHANQALELARIAGDLLAQHHALSALAAVRGESGDHSGSLPLHRQALELARRLSLRRREAIDLANLGECHYERRSDELAVKHFRHALAIFIEIGDRACEGDCRVNLGRAMLARGDGAKALTMLDRGRILCESTGRAEYVAIAWLHQGDAHLALDDPGAAAVAYAEAQERFTQLGSHHLWRADYGRARAEHARGRPQAALEIARLAARRVATQRDRLPPEADASGFDLSASGVFALVEDLEQT